MSSSVHIDNKKKYNLIFGRSPPQGLGEHSLTKSWFSLNLHYNGANLFVNSVEVIKFKAKDSEIIPKCFKRFCSR